MKATQVRILPALDPGESYVEPKFLLVETTLDAAGEAVTTIHQMSSDIVAGRVGWSVSTLGHGVPMTHSAAREWAVSYAASRGIPLVYESDSTSGEGYAAAQSAGAPPARASSASK